MNEVLRMLQTLSAGLLIHSLHRFFAIPAYESCIAEPYYNVDDQICHDKEGDSWKI